MPQNQQSQTPGRRLALVTGASSGIGRELARQFAEHDFDLVITGASDEIERTAGELATYGGKVHSVTADLTTYEGVERVWATFITTCRPLAAAALNAGVGQGKAFVDTELDDQLRVVDLNVRSTVQLAYRVLSEMTRRQDGRVLFTSSIAAMQPGAFQAVYNASKSFVQSFAQALREELKDSGVSVTALMPGPTDTAFFDRADLRDTKVGQADKDDPALVARQGFEALMNGEAKVVAGSMKTKAMAQASKVLPDSVNAKLHRSMVEPDSDG